MSPPIFLRLVPRAVAHDEDRVVVFAREHVARIEAHAERRRMRPELRHRLGKLIAAVAPTEFRVGDVAAVAIGEAEIVLAGVGEAVELIVRLILRQPVALVLGEIQQLQHRVPIHADNLADTTCDDLHPAAVEVDAADLRVRRRRHADVARCADVEIELIVGPDGQEFPTVRRVVRQIAVDDRRLRRVVELAFDIVDLRDLVDRRRCRACRCGGRCRSANSARWRAF